MVGVRHSNHHTVIEPSQHPLFSKTKLNFIILPDPVSTYPLTMPGDKIRLLALDGGGVRGLSMLQILKQLMDIIDPQSPPNPCDYFDMIGGTSTGGLAAELVYNTGFIANEYSLIAIMLGRLQMTVDECIDAYVLLSDRVFQKRRHRVTIKGKVQGRFDSDELEQAIKEIVVKKGLEKDALLRDSPDAKCKV
jgi:hypothetical protein